MAKDYFQDIVPPENNPPQRSARKRAVPPPPPPPPPPEEDLPEEADVAEGDDDLDVGLPPERSIRNIAPSKTRMRMTERESTGPGGGIISVGSRKWGLWVAAGLGVIAIAIFGLFAFRNSSVVVIPRVQPVSFDDTSHFTAYPEEVAATGTLQYKMVSADIEDSEPVAAQGMQHAETKASGSITISNSYSNDPVKLIKNTRFESNGLIYRTPADILVPGKKGSAPGTVNVTVMADEAGDKYNIAPSSFTLPGLKSNAAMYSGVTAKSSAAFSGGFVGDQPAVAPATLTATISAVRERIARKAYDSMQAQNEYVTFPDLVQITYQSMPSSVEAGGGVRIHEKAHVTFIAFPTNSFAKAIARSVSSDADNTSIRVVSVSNFGGKATTQSSDWGVKPVDFVLSGQAKLVWVVDTDALGKALSGRDESAFQTVIASFPSIQEAHARIQPFWRSSFPAPEKISIQLQEPSSSQ